MKKTILISASLLLCFSASFFGCAGEDYTPVYFPSGAGSQKPTQPSDKTRPSQSQARCLVQLSAKLCVTIKGEKLEVGTKKEEPLCADTPPIPMEFEGEKVFLKGKDFPDIQVQVKIKGVDTPMTINGKGSTDGSQNVGEGSWSPEGDMTIQNFSFFINVLGVSGEIPKLNLTTEATKDVPGLSPLEGQSASADGKIKLVTSTVLGHLFEAADKFLLGASLQASLEGTLTPPLTECFESVSEGPRHIRIVKIHLDPSGKMMEESIPEGNILEVSKGTFIAQGSEDVGPSFEQRAHFRAFNETDKPIPLQIPSHLGPFYFQMEGKSIRTLSPKNSFKFRVLFKPNRTNTPKAGAMKQSFVLGQDRFFLMGIAQEPKGKLSVNRTEESGQTVAAGINALVLNPLAVPASSIKGFFKCEKIKCENREAITKCESCAMANQNCFPYPLNTQGKPLEEVTKECKPLHPSSLSMIGVDLASTTENPLQSAKQLITLENLGVKDLTIQNILVEEIPNSKSTGQFQFSKDSIRMGSKIEEANPQNLPLILPPFQKGFEETSVYFSVTYLPDDLVGADGKQAASGQDVVDKAILKIETDVGEKKIQLMGKTKIQDVPELQAYFGTAIGLKAKANLETFALQEVTATTQDMAFPVFLKMADAATGGLRIIDIRLMGKDLSFFEWLDTSEKVQMRQPPSGKGKRCSIPIFDPTSGRQIDERFDLTFLTLGSQGFDLKPSHYTLESMPLFGCINFHKGGDQEIDKRLFQTSLVVTALKLDSQGRLQRNPDNTFQQTSLTIPLAAAIDPLRGKMVLRITQTTAAILNPQAPSLTAIAAKREVEAMVKEGKGTFKEQVVMLGAIILDPFDEKEITDAQDRVVNKPGDGFTAVFRAVDTRPSINDYEEEGLFDFTSLLHDSNLPVGKQGIFYDYDFEGHPLPDSLKISGWRIFTGALSYPGPLSPRSPVNLAECDVIDPCSPEGLRKFTRSGAGPTDRGACSFFYTSGARYQSPSFEPVIQNETVDVCATRDQPQDLLAMNNGVYSVEGSFTAEDLGMRFWGPNYFNNPAGPLGFKPPLDEVFHIAFTTEILKPKTHPKEFNVLPDEKIDFSRQEHKINLTETDLSVPPICPTNTLNRTLGGRKYSSWRYFAPLLFKDEAGEIPAGCPEPGSKFTGGTAYLKGRRLDPETGVFTLVASGKFGSKEDLSLAFKNIMMFIAINAWICDPQGDENNFEGSKCFEPKFNDRDAKAQISIMTDEK